MSKVKQAVTANLPVIGALSPYSYQVKPKKYGDATQVRFNGEPRNSRLTKGQGKGSVTKFYVYFMEGSFQHWIELPEATFNELKNNPAATLVLTTQAAEQLKVEDKQVAEPTKPARKAKRQPVEA